MKKRLLPVLIALVLLTGCGNEGNTADQAVSNMAQSAEVVAEASLDTGKDLETDNASKNLSSEADKEKTSDTSEQSQQLEPQQETVQATPQKPDYGRIIFTGDSRTVDMFYSDRNEIWGEAFDGIPVYCRDACQSDYMINAVNS